MLLASPIRLATCADSDRIAAMSRDHVECGLGWTWTPSRVRASIADRDTNVIVMHEQQRLVAFAIMAYGEATAHLALLAVDPSWRRRGRATQLLQWLERSADTAGIGLVRLEVRADNPGASAFYERQGYSFVARVAGYYRGTLDALRLEKSLRRGAA